MESRDSIKFCDFANPRMTCAACGYKATKKRTTRVCRPVRQKQWQPVDVGDLVERGLSAIGITKARVEKLTRTAGKPGGCGCAKRKKWLTEVGNEAQIAARKAIHKAKDFYFGS